MASAPHGRFAFSGKWAELRERCVSLWQLRLVGAHSDYDTTPNCLGKRMKALKKLEVSREAANVAEARALLREIERERGLAAGSLDAQYPAYQELCTRAGDAEALSEANEDVWGSRRQLLSGKVVMDVLATHHKYAETPDPVFGALLNPTGGIVGPGNARLLFRRFVAPVLTRLYSTDVLMAHGAMHDAAGYLWNFHGVGPGYTYTPSKLLPNRWAWLGQLSGLRLWKQVEKVARAAP